MTHRHKASLTNPPDELTQGVFTPYIAGGKASASRNCPDKLGSKYCPPYEGSCVLDPEGPVGVAARLGIWTHRHKEGVGNSLLLPWGVFFGTPQPGPPKETRLGRGGF